jgi:hypothetical protein
MNIRLVEGLALLIAFLTYMETVKRRKRDETFE